MKRYFSTNRVLACAIVSVTIVTFFFACKKQASTDTAPSNEINNQTIAVAQHETAANNMYAGLFETVATVAVSQGTATEGRLAAPRAETLSCPASELIDDTGNSWPKHVKVDFGTSCTSEMGIVRSGILNITFSGPLYNAGAIVVVELSNYKVNGILVEGRYTISNASYNNTTGVQYTTEVNGGKIIFSDSLVVNYAGKHNIKQTAGGASPLNKSDDVYSLEGTATLSYIKAGVTGAIALFATQTPLTKMWACQHITQGQLKVDFNNLSGVIDYGNGKCDAIAMLKVGNTVQEITLQ